MAHITQNLTERRPSIFGEHVEENDSTDDTEKELLKNKRGQSNVTSEFLEDNEEEMDSIQDLLLFSFPNMIHNPYMSFIPS